MNKVYIRVTEALEGDPNVIATLESYGGKNLNKYTAVAGTILFINTFEVIDKWMASDNAVCNLCSHGYQEIFPENVSHTYHLPVPKDNAPSTSIILPLNVPKGYEAIVGGKPVTEIEVEIRKVERWKPTYGEQYFHASVAGITGLAWTNSLYDIERYEVGNCFKTEDEAAAYNEILRKHLKLAFDEYNKTFNA